MPLTFIPEGISVTTRENEDTEYLFIQNFGEKTETVSVSAAETAITDVSASREQKRTDNFLKFIKTS